MSEQGIVPEPPDSNPDVTVNPDAPDAQPDNDESAGDPNESPQEPTPDQGDTAP